MEKVYLVEKRKFVKEELVKREIVIATSSLPLLKKQLLYMVGEYCANNYIIAGTEAAEIFSLNYKDLEERYEVNLNDEGQQVVTSYSLMNHGTSTEIDFLFTVMVNDG